jgi:ABC-type dipeptide/oligopeptide/nickel transport system permease component
MSLILRRVGELIPTLFGVLVITFGVLYLMPGDPVEGLVSSFEAGGTPEQVAALRAKYGLDKPLQDQFVRYIGGLLVGDMGESVSQHQPVGKLLMRAIPHTAELALWALVISILVGIPLGVLSAVKRNTWLDSVAILFAMIGVSVPDGFFALSAVVVFAVLLGWLPAFGAGGVAFLILPAAVLGIRAAAAIARLTRSSMLDVLSVQFITTARARGVGELVVITRHALRNALIPVMTLLGLEFGRLLAGAVVVETVFNRPGIGGLLVTAILNKDVPVIRGTVLLIALTYILVNLLVDLSYSILNPKIRY